jgi:hypothetical protein
MEPEFRVTYRVVAYDEGGYGDNRSREFPSGQEAVEYAKGLELRFGAIVMKTITMQPINVKIYDARTDSPSK